jgi:drug/metabolite transporter (DMT)-like permease
MLYGLGAALGFGLADLFGAVSTRRIGVPLTLFVIQIVSLVALSVLLLTPVPGNDPLSARGGALVALTAAGAMGTVSFFAFYRALQLGPVAVVSPVFASYAAVAVLLSVVFAGERLSTMAWAGLALTIPGVALASARGEEGDDGRRSWGGIPYALVATLAWGAASYLIGKYARQTGWFLPVYVVRIVEFVLTGAVMILLRTRGAVFSVPRGTTLAIPAASSLADAAAIGLFAHASQIGSISIAAAVSATFPLVVIAGGLIMFHERPSPRQWLGVLGAITGLILLGLGR